MYRILLLDDYGPVRIHLRVLLSMLGFLCDEAESEIEALELLSDNDYDVALVDLILPSGLPKCLFHKCDELGIPIVVITGMSHETARKFAPQGSSILVKPFDAELLEEFILRMVVEKARRPQQYYHDSDVQGM